jgi:hypothetical protein
MLEADAVPSSLGLGRSAPLTIIGTFVLRAPDLPTPARM